MVAACAIGTSIVFEIFTEEERGQRDGVDAAELEGGGEGGGQQ
jgi:hypothetical protein